MGGSSSKAARSATGAASRKYPQRIPNVTATAPRTSAQEVSGAPASSRLQATRSEAPEVQEQLTSDTDPLASTTKTDAINQDASDPLLASHLRKIGPVAPNPFSSRSSLSPLDHHSASAPSTHSSQLSNSNPQATTQNPYSQPLGGPLPPPAFPSARNNPVLSLLAARKSIQEAVEAEQQSLGRKGFEGRRFLDVGMVKRVLVMREKGQKTEDIERELGLRKGLVEKLGRRGVVDVVGGS